MEKYKKNKAKFNYGRIIDLILLIVFPLLAFLLIFTLKKFTTKYTIMAGVILTIIYLICFLTILLKNKKIHIIRRILMVLLCVALGYGYTYSSNIANSFSNLTGNSANKTTTIKMDILVKKSSTITSIQDLSKKIIAFQTANDSENSDYVLKKLNNTIGTSYRKLQYNDYTTMYSDYYNGYNDAIVVNQSQKKTLPTNYASLYKDSKVLKTYNRVIKNVYTGNNVDVTKQVFTVYISASDQTGVPASRSLSDMNMLMIIDPVSNTIKTISIPRDSFVPNPAYDNQNDKLTHTGNNGIENTVKAVENMFQIDIDFYAKISFDSLIKIVDTLGGISVDVGIDFCEQDENRSFAAEDEVCLKAGVQTLNGKQALAYSRHRHSYINQDIGRNEAQSRVIKGIIKKMMTTDGVNKIDDVLNILPTYVITNFSDTQLSSFVKKQVDEMKDWKMSSMSLQGGASDMAVTASGGSSPLSVYYLSEHEVSNINAVYNLLKSKPSMNKFTYDKRNLYQQFTTWKSKTNTVMTK